MPSLVGSEMCIRDSFRCPAVSACVCASRSFSALFLRVPHRGCTGFILPNRPNTTATLLPIRYRVIAFLSPSCNRTPKPLPCSMMGSACPVHAPYGPAPVEFGPFIKPHQPCTAVTISVFSSCNDMYQVVYTRYQVSDRALFSPCSSRLLLFVRVPACFERIREPSR